MIWQRLRLNKERSTQVAPFMILIISLMIPVIAATILLGEVVYQRIRVSNVLDSAPLGPISGLCRGLNQIRQIHYRMLINYVHIQAFLLSHVWASPLDAWIGVATHPYAIINNYDLWKSAKEIAKDLNSRGVGPIRQGLYDHIFGGGLIDEPNPMPVERDAQGNIIGLDYDANLDQESYFTQKYRAFKKPPNHSSWYNSDTLIYSWRKWYQHKEGEDTRTDQGKMEAKKLRNDDDYEPDDPADTYDGYLQVSVDYNGLNLEIKKQSMLLLYFFVGSGGVFVPSVIPHPWAWIKTINPRGGKIIVSATKRAPFTPLPFFGRSVNIDHSATVIVDGNKKNGWKPKLQ